MATRKKPQQKQYDILTGTEIVEKVAPVPVPVAGDKPPTVDDVIKSEYPDVLLHPEPVIVQMAILRELIRMRGCENGCTNEH